MSTFTTEQLRAAIAVLAPAVLMASFLYHPHVGNPIDADFLAKLEAAVLADPTRWAVAHYMAAVGSGLLMLAFLAVRGYLRDVGEDRWSAVGLPPVIFGSTLYALLPALEFAPLTAALTGGDVQATQAVLMPWFLSTLLAGAVFFALGAGAFAAAVARSRALAPGLTRLVVVALVVMALARFVPISAVQFYVHGVAGLAAFWTLAYAMWRQPVVRRADASRPVATS
jgi:hypothetical protein